MPDKPSAVKNGLPQRFFDRIRLEGSCWMWTGFQHHGYGRFSVNRKMVFAHRASYEATFGPIPPGLVIDHLCRNRACVNPTHLDVVTRGENTRRGAHHRCPHDKVSPNRNPSGGCRICKAELQSRPERREKQREYRRRPESMERERARSKRRRASGEYREKGWDKGRIRR